MNSRKHEFILFLKNNQELLCKDEWKRKTNLYDLWKQRIDENDIRYKLCNGDVEKFVDVVYDYLKNHLDDFLGAVYDSAFSSKRFRDFDIVNLENSKIIYNISNNPGYFRNICFEEIVICGGDADINLSIRNVILNTLNGTIRKTFFMPSLFQDIFDGKVTSNMVLTFNKSCKLASIFSPNVYRYLLRSLNTHSKGNSILFATASWGVPVIAADNLNYKIVDIVDVQKTVLDKCHVIKDDLIKNTIFAEAFELNTYCTPSEVMDQVISKKYDHIISCPPYYDLEIYGASDQQSTDLYSSYEEWLEKYWRRTVIASKNLLNENGIFSFVMGYHVRYQYMSNDMTEIAKQEGFNLIDEIKIVPKKKPENLYLSPIEKYEICSIFKRSS